MTKRKESKMKNEVINVIEFAGYEMMDYSGRNMFGKYCLAIQTSNGIMETLSELIDAAHSIGNVKELSEAIRNMKTDSLGYNTVMYFPTIPYTHSKVKCSHCNRNEAQYNSEYCGGTCEQMAYDQD